MKFIEQAGSFERDGFLLDGKHPVLVQALTPTVVRVLVRKNGRLRLDRTWCVSQGGEVPWEGRSRLDITAQPLRLNGTYYDTDQVRLQVHPDPYHLEWFYQGKSVLKERSTGSLAFGRRHHRIWHFHQLRPESRFYGLGERSGEIDRRGRRFEMRNVDPMGYDARTTDPLYKHFPFYIEHNQDGCFGLFYDNLATTVFDLGQEIDNYHGPFTSYRAEDGDFDLYFIAGPNLLEVTRAFSQLTGPTYLPPKWSLGYSTTSMTYTDVDQAQQRLEQFLDESEAHGIETATFKYGSGYTSKEGRRYVFTWNRDKFPDPRAINQRFHQRGIRLAANVKPVLLTDHPDYEEATPLFVQDSQEERQEISQFWDARGSHLDFSNPQTIRWWQQKAEEQLLDYGFDALWNDNNEYVIWDDEARCHGFGRPLPIGLVRPLMSQWMTRASHELLQHKQPGQRVWSITRCGCPGMQRYAQTWSGDNFTAWDTLEYNHKMALGLSMSGIYNIGHDVGGFAGPAPEPELLARWYFLGAMMPRFGVNSWKADGTITEPWMHPQVLPAVRRALQLRQRFLPQLYSLMAECAFEATPLLRPTWVNFPDGEDTEFMWGENLLVAPIFQPGQSRREVYLPSHPHGWWDFHSGIHHPGGTRIEVPAPLDSIPLLVAGGSALLLSDGIHLYPGGAFQTEFYDDDGETLGGDFLRLRLEVSADLVVEISCRGSYRPYPAVRLVTPERSWEQPL